MSVSEQMINVLSYVEQVYWEDGQRPTDEKSAEMVGCDISYVKKCFKSEQFRDAAYNRGISLGRDDPGEEILSFEQLTAVSVLLNTYDRRSMREKLDFVGISTQKLNSWMRDPKFAVHLRKRAEKQFAESDTKAYMSIIKGMEDGDLKATQLFLEMRGLYNPRVDVNINVDSVLTRVVEIISKHVKDPAILGAIADDLEMLDGVRPPVPVAPTRPEPITVSSQELPELTY